MPSIQGASYDPDASILDDTKAAARRSWPHNVRPRDLLTSSGRRILLPTNESTTASMKEDQAGLRGAWTAPAPVQPQLEPDLNLSPFERDDDDEISLDDVRETESAADKQALHTRMRPPADKRTRKKYFALRTRAANARTAHPQQARKLDAQADALMEPAIDEAPGSPRGTSTRMRPRRQQSNISACDIDPIWIDLQVYQIRTWGTGTPHQRQRAAALLELLLPVFAAVGVEPWSILADPEPLVLADYLPKRGEAHADPALADCPVDAARAA